MAVLIQFGVAVPVGRAIRRKRQIVSRTGLMAWLRAASARWRERRLLEELDDQALRDMGISRSQALAEAAKPFWRR
jgi:uncharacterized protein YjiS (DUF1127 family)